MQLWLGRVAQQRTHEMVITRQIFPPNCTRRLFGKLQRASSSSSKFNRVMVVCPPFSRAASPFSKSISPKLKNATEKEKKLAFHPRSDRVQSAYESIPKVNWELSPRVDRSLARVSSQTESETSLQTDEAKKIHPEFKLF